eukprot:349678-Chlamydomonas_euryale.AAC.4
MGHFHTALCAVCCRPYCIADVTGNGGQSTPLVACLPMPFSILRYSPRAAPKQDPVDQRDARYRAHWCANAQLSACPAPSHTPFPPRPLPRAAHTSHS